MPEYTNILTVPTFDCNFPPIIAPNNCPKPPYMAFKIMSIVALIPGGLIRCAYMLPDNQKAANPIPQRASTGKEWYGCFIHA